MAKLTKLRCRPQAIQPSRQTLSAATSPALPTHKDTALQQQSSAAAAAARWVDTRSTTATWGLRARGRSEVKVLDGMRDTALDMTSGAWAASRERAT